MNRFTHQIVIVTGAANGIGRAIARRFAAEGAHVVVADLNLAGAEAAAQGIRDAGGRAEAARCDVSAEADVDAMFDAVLAVHGKVDVLVNNAGVTNANSPYRVERHVLEGDSAWWNKVIAINLTGAFLCSLRAAKAMAPRGSGVIINMSSGGASKAHRGMVAYDAAKAGIEGMTRALALDLAPYGVRVHTLVPGSIDTAGLAAEARVQRGANIPLARVGDPDELAGPALFLASSDASYITGHCLYVDGGMLIQQRSATVDIFPLDKFPKLDN